MVFVGRQADLRNNALCFLRTDICVGPRHGYDLPTTKSIYLSRHHLHRGLGHVFALKEDRLKLQKFLRLCATAPQTTMKIFSAAVQESFRELSKLILGMLSGVGKFFLPLSWYADKIPELHAADRQKEGNAKFHAISNLYRTSHGGESDIAMGVPQMSAVMIVVDFALAVQIMPFVGPLEEGRRRCKEIDEEYLEMEKHKRSHHPDPMDIDERSSSECTPKRKNKNIMTETADVSTVDFICGQPEVDTVVVYHSMGMIKQVRPRRPHLLLQLNVSLSWGQWIAALQDGQRQMSVVPVDEELEPKLRLPGQEHLSYRRSGGLMGLAHSIASLIYLEKQEHLPVLSLPSLMNAFHQSGQLTVEDGKLYGCGWMPPMLKHMQVPMLAPGSQASAVAAAMNAVMVNDLLTQMDSATQVRYPFFHFLP